MALKKTIDQDLKQAMLSGEKELVTTLRGIKSVILYAEVAADKREDGLSDDVIIDLLMKEAKKRDESAALYIKGGNQERADNELQEKKIIEQYLPSQLSDEDLEAVVTGVIAERGEAADMSHMGAIIGAVKSKVGASADGSRIANAVKKQIG